MEIVEKRILAPEEKHLIDLKFYEVCKKIFGLIDEGKITGVILDKLHISENKIEKSYTYFHEDIDFSGDFSRFEEGWYTLAKRKRNGKIKKGFRVTPEDQMQFLEDYEDEFKEQISDRISTIQSEHNSTMQKIR